MSSSNVCPSSVEELGDKEGPIPTNAGPASNVIEPKPGKATSAVASPSQALEDSTIIDTSGDSMSHPLQQNTVRTWPEYRHALSHNTNTTIRSHPISHFGSLPTRRLWSINSPRSLQTSLPEPSLAHEATSNEFHPISHFGLLLTRQLWAVRRPQFHLTAPPSESSHSHEAPLNQFHLISHFGSLPTRGLWLYRRPQIHLTAPPSEPLPSRVTSSPTHALPLDTALPTESIHSHEALLNQFHPISHFGSLPTRGLWLYRRPQIHLTAPPSEPLPSRILARVTSPAHPLPLDTTLYPEPVLSRVTSLVHTLPLDTALLRQTSPQVEPLQPETRSPSKAISPPYSSPLRSQNSLPLQTYLNPESRSTSEFVSPTFTPPSPLKTSFPSNNPDHFAASLTNTSLLLETPLSAEAQLVTLNSSSVHDETLQTEQHHPDVVNPDLTVSYQTPVGPTEATSLNQPPITDPTTAPVESLSQLPHVPSNNSSSHDIAISSHTVKGASTPSNSPDPVEQSNTYRFVSSTEPSTVPGLTPVEYSESDSTSVHPLHGVSKLAYDQMVTNCKFIKSICEIQAQFRHTKLKMPDTDCEVCDLYYSTVEQIEALEIEIGLPSTLSPSEDAQSGAMLPVITRLNFYYETLGLEQIRNPPSACDFHRGSPRKRSIIVPWSFWRSISSGFVMRSLP
ncbi:uncharacterized protein N7511_009262 [Penicillium nucicola]|uniref:uncharacterized protein n=1 Tax=Penicillium nucicola TaxID=1850975 RepID=UPI0025455DEC|nr:uncharacterized protein N7511_009262 [Penicillium nucicola]KAJ5747566.1 hypothetical protein N7511_009262 [Penicillium nucicola]